MRRFITMLAVLMLTQACTHKDLCYDHPHTIDIDVEFDWSKAPDAMPETMSLYLFPEDGGKVQRYEFTDHTSGRIRVLPGRYKTICMNSDTRNIRFGDRSSFETCFITTDETDLVNRNSTLDVRNSSIPKARGTEEERIIMSPDSIWTASMDEIVVDSLCRKISFTPEEAFIQFKVEIRNVENIQYLSGSSGALSSMAGAFFPGPKKMSEEKATIPFNTHISRKENMLSGKFLVFGHCPVTENQHFLTLYCHMADGSNFYCTYDVTEQIHSSNNDVITIILDHLPLPEPEPGEGGEGGGFQPTVGGWESIDIGIQM